MTPNNQKQLFEHFPRTFRCVPEQLRPIDVRGIECGDGWFKLIEEVATLSEQVAVGMERNGRPASEWPRVAQIKEKFGALTIYMTGGPYSPVRAAIDAARTASEHICEKCGQPGELPSNQERKGWIQTLCQACRSLPESPSDMTAWLEQQEVVRNLLDGRKVFE